MSDLHLTTSNRPMPELCPNAKDHTGKIFGRLTTVKRVGGTPTKYLCSCTCGNSTEVVFFRLSSGATKSCGCLAAEMVSARKTTHGMSLTPEYVAWGSMWSRCTDVNNHAYAAYKDRRPPEEWRDFTVFLAHVGLKPSPEHSLDRVDNDKPYGPGNVRWATHKEQCNNTKANRLITYNGKTQTMTQWARDVGLNPRTLKSRLNSLGWSIEKALTTPVSC